jgi:murein DD-endopeptidase MepM/ murein hydrolase activator NlpD
MQVDMHHKRRLLIALLAASGMSAGLGSFAVTANAAKRTFVITVVGHLKKTITLDVGQNVPLDQIQLPSILGLPILSIQEITPTQAPAPAPTPTPTTQTPTVTVPGVTADPSAPALDQPSGSDQTQSQRTTGRAKRVPHAGERALDTAGHVIGSVITKVERARPQRTPLRLSDGIPTLQNPTMSLALPGPVAVGVPNFFINKFRIPVFLLPIYQAAGIQYGVPWEVLSAINEIETDYGRNLNVSSAGAVGWMQFLMSSWKIYGVDANGDGKKDPYNPVDAIFASARYLKAAGAEQDLRKAIFAYNHADWYVNSVLMRARFIGGMPADLVGSLSGLTQARFPVHAEARYADDISERAATRRVARGRNAALPVEANTSRRGINIYAKAGSPVIAVQDGRITKVGNNDRLGNFVVLRDVYGNSYTYAGLKKIAKQVPVPKPKTQSKASIAKELALPRDAKPAAPASAGKNVGKAAKVKAAKKVVATAPSVTHGRAVAKERLFANPTRPKALSAGGKRQLLESESTLADGVSFKNYFSGVYGLKRDDVVLKRLVPGRRVIAGTILGRIGRTSTVLAPHVLFEIRPAGRGAPRIDPQPILDGWKVLEATAIYRAQGKNAFFGDNSQGATIGQILLMSKEALAQRVLSNPRIDLYSCGRRDIEAGIVDRRVLAVLEFLAAGGLKPSVTSLQCGHGYYTAGGNVSAHSSGNAVDIAKINGIPIMGNQGVGSITDITIRRLLTLQGTIKPAQIISLMTYDGTDNTLALPDHNDHIHVGFRPQFDSTTKAGKVAESVLKPSQWVKLIDRLGQIDNPTVQVKPSKYAIKAAPGRASEAHAAE